MAKLLNKSKVIKIMILSLIIFLIDCTDNHNYKRQINSDESYLNIHTLKNLIIPNGILLSLQNDEYDIPLVNQNGSIGKTLDIRPPIQTLLLLVNTYSDNSLTTSRLFLKNTVENSTLWQQINTILHQKTIFYIKKNDIYHSLITDWIIWPRGDEEIFIKTRQKIELKKKNNQIIIEITNKGIKKGEQNITDPMQIQRYNILMMNELIDSINKLRNRKITSNLGILEKRYTTIDIETINGDNGLSQIVVHAPYDIIWNRLPSVLNHMNMKINDSIPSIGSITITYSGISDSYLQIIGIDNLTIKNGVYKLQVGDIDNYTSLQFMTSKGITLTQKQNNEIVKVLRLLFNKVSDR
ncbi:MAG: outer membrane protein assembly factor BamC [Arsenophonus sp. ER-BJ3-MAG3]